MDGVDISQKATPQMKEPDLIADLIREFKERYGLMADEVNRLENRLQMHILARDAYRAALSSLESIGEAPNMAPGDMRREVY